MNRLNKVKFSKFNDTKFVFLIVLQAYQDRPQLSSTEFFDLVVNLHQTLNEAMEGGEKFEELLKYIDNFQAQVFH